MFIESLARLNYFLQVLLTIRFCSTVCTLSSLVYIIIRVTVRYQKSALQHRGQGALLLAYNSMEHVPQLLTATASVLGLHTR